MSTKTTAPSRPTHRAFFVTGEGDDRRWHELGALWAHKDGNGFTFKPDVLPAAGQPITIRLIKQENEETKAAA